MHHTPEQLLAMAAESARGERHVTEHALCDFMSACVAPFAAELGPLWDDTRAGRASIETLRRAVKDRTAASAHKEAPVGSLAVAYAATAMLHAGHALAVLRQTEITTVALYRLRISVAQAYSCAATAAELTPRAWASGTRVEEALRRALVPCAAA